jgi:formylmethanofuran--tetrahydromethanopterin N-formyltransferase
MSIRCSRSSWTASIAAHRGRDACRTRGGVYAGVIEITAGNYGGKLGKHHFRLHDLA